MSAVQEIPCSAIVFSTSATQAARRAHFKDEELDDLVAAEGRLEPQEAEARLLVLRAILEDYLARPG